MTQPDAPTAAPNEPAPQQQTPQGQTFSQADVDRIVSERLSRERSRYADYDTLKQKATEFDKLADAQKSETQKLNDRLTEAERRASGAELTSLRIDVALEKAPPGMDTAKIRKLAGRLTGTTREELEKDADELFAEFASKPADTRRPVEDLKSGALPASGTSEIDMNAWMRGKARAGTR